MRRLTLPLVLMLTVALGACGKKNEDPAAVVADAQKVEVDKEFGEKVRAYLIQNPEVLVEVSNALQLKQMAAAEQAVEQGFARNKAKLQRDRRDFVINPDGKVTVVQFYDYNCGYCKLVAPEVLAMARQNRNVRFVFKDYTLGNFGPTSEYAAAAARAMGDKGMFPDAHAEMMSRKPLTDEMVDDLLRRNGIDPASVRALEAGQPQQQYLADVRELAKEMGIEGTPAFFVEGDFISGARPDELKAAIAKALSAK
ncbi:MAG TPA: thioredoxin domain-containing protein [Caulobacter sp.]|nr:thioredoxin domain-containing protein [Caulobacter sp.]